MKKQQTPLDRAIEIVKLASLARELGVTYQAIYKWRESGRLPMTELSGESTYAAVIEKATGGQVSQKELIEWSFPKRICCENLANNSFNDSCCASS